MSKIDDEIQALLLEHRGDIRSILKDNHRLDLLYALSSQRELLLEWYDFEPEAEVLQVGADYGALTGLFRSSVRAVTVLDDTESGRSKYLLPKGQSGRLCGRGLCGGQKV